MVGWRRRRADYAIWVSPKGTNEFVGAYVNDMAVAARKETRSMLKSHLRKHFQVTNLGDLRVYVGLTIEQDRATRKTFISQ